MKTNTRTSLPAIPSQPTNGNRYGLMATPVPQPAVKPRSWSFIDRRTDETVQYSCMRGCSLDHSHEVGRRIFREDVWCWTEAQPLTLPVNTNGTPEEFRILDTVLKVEPWAPEVAHRLPFAVIELVDDHFIDGLDPDGLETVINTLAGRLGQMRETHRRLAELRADYKRQAEGSEGGAV